MCTVLEFLFLIGCFEDMDIFCDFNSGLIGSFIYDKYSQNYKFTGVSSGSSGVDLSVKAIQSEVSNFYMTVSVLYCKAPVSATSLRAAMPQTDIIVETG